MSCAKRLLIFFLILYTTVQAQDDDPFNESHLFSMLIELNIREYNHKAEVAFLNHDLERVESLFDSIVEKVVVGSYIDNFNVTRYRRKKTKLHDFNKPIFLITYSDWYPFAPGEIAALNQIAAIYAKQVDFLVLFFEPYGKVQKYSKKFSRKINLLYADEKTNKYSGIIKSMKHSFGVPTVFYIDENKKFVDVGRMPAHHFQEEFEPSFNSKYSFFLEGVKQLIRTSDNTSSILTEKEKDNDTIQN